jgi:hypothetical protein
MSEFSDNVFVYQIYVPLAELLDTRFFISDGKTRTRCVKLVTHAHNPLFRVQQTPCRLSLCKEKDLRQCFGIACSGYLHRAQHLLLKTFLFLIALYVRESILSNKLSFYAVTVSFDDSAPHCFETFPTNERFPRISLDGGIMIHLRLSTFITVLAALLAVAVLASSIPASAAWRYKKKKSGSAKYKSYKSSAKSKRYAGSRSKRRHRVACNTGAGRQQAYAFLQSSKELAALASLEYKFDPNVQEYIDNDRGELADDEVDEAETLEIIDVEDARFTADASTLRKLWFAYIRNVDPAERAAHAEDNFIAGSIDRKELMAHIVNWIGSPYYYGGVQRSGVDCSAFVRAIYRAVADIYLPRTAAIQSTIGEHVRSAEDLKFGDLVFFNTRSGVYVSHVGIYLGDNLFAHASSRYGVTVSSLQADYYKGRFLGGKRLRPEDVQLMASGNRAFSALRVKTGSTTADE